MYDPTNGSVTSPLEIKIQFHLNLAEDTAGRSRRFLLFSVFHDKRETWIRLLCTEYIRLRKTFYARYEDTLQTLSQTINEPSNFNKISRNVMLANL